MFMMFRCGDWLSVFRLFFVLFKVRLGWYIGIIGLFNNSLIVLFVYVLFLKWMLILKRFGLSVFV